MSINIDDFVTRADKSLTKLDDETIKRLTKLFQGEYDKIEAELRKLYNAAGLELKDSSRLFREARARLLLEQLGDILEVLQGDEVIDILSEHITKTTTSEVKSVTEALKAFGAAQTVSVPVEIIRTVVSNIQDNLKHHGQIFALQAEEVIVQGLINGHGFGKMASELRKKSGIVRYKAETIVRTETMQASDYVRRSSYQQNGVQYVIRVATQDTRVCGHCLARAGNVYKVEEAPQSIHPNDRCYNMPFKPEWLELGLLDEQWFIKHREAATERSKEKPNRGAAPFEKSAGIQPPDPIWVPGRGYTKFYRTT